MNEVAIKLSTVNSLSLRLVQITNQNSYRNVTACVHSDQPGVGINEQASELRQLIL